MADTTAAAIIYALARLAPADVTVFAREVIALCGASSRQARLVVRALVAAIRAAAAVTTRSHTATTRVYTIRYAPQRSTTTFFAIEYEIVDWTTEIIEDDDGRVKCIAMPVFAERALPTPRETFYPEYETIATTQVLDVGALLARKHVCSVTCEQMSTKVAIATDDDEATASESEDDDDLTCDRERVAMTKGTSERDQDPSPVPEPTRWPALAMDALETDSAFHWTVAMYQSHDSTRRAVGSVLLQRRLLGL